MKNILEKIKTKVKQLNMTVCIGAIFGVLRGIGINFTQERIKEN